jgi:hypothetical protein
MIWVEVGEAVVGIAVIAISAGVIMLVAGTQATSSQVEQKAVALLQPWLSPEQAEQYSSYRYFEVIGSDTGKRYRIRHGRMMNVDELDSVGNRVCEWCFLPEGKLAAGDVMLAQKIALEAFESQALAVANRSRTLPRDGSHDIPPLPRALAARDQARPDRAPRWRGGPPVHPPRL